MSWDGILILVLMAVAFIGCGIGAVKFLIDDAEEQRIHKAKKAYIKQHPVEARKQELSWMIKPSDFSDAYTWGDEYEYIKVKEEALQELADSFMYLFDGMPKVKVLLVKGETKEWERPAAMGGGGYIYVKKSYYDSAPHESLVKTIKHELTHNWTYWKGIKEDSHGPEFERKLSEVTA